jgi:hypothetical protein
MENLSPILTFRKRLSRNASGKSLDRLSICSLEDLRPPRRICSRHSGRDLQLEDSDCEQLSASFAALPNKYELFEVGKKIYSIPQFSFPFSANVLAPFLGQFWIPL